MVRNLLALFSLAAFSACGNINSVGSANGGDGGDAGEGEAEAEGEPSGCDGSCDDGLFCNGAEACVAGACVSAGDPCAADTLACTNGCDEASNVCFIDPGTCVIDSSCYADGEVNTANTCEGCDADVSQSAWTADCDDGLYCNGAEACVTSACASAGDPCAADGLACTNGCDEDINACLIDSGACLIDDACVADGEVNTANTCERCDADVSKSAWTADCDDGLYCNGAEACVASACVSAGDPCAADALTCTNACDEDSDACLVDSGMCLIDDTCRADGEANPLNSCEECVAGTNQTGWTPDDSNSCDDGSFCTTSDACLAGLCSGSSPTSCVDDGLPCTTTCNESLDACNTIDAGSCVVDVACYADGTANPLNDCQSCDSVGDPSGWTPKAPLSPCGDGSTSACDDPNSCDGAGVCLSNPKPPSVQCRDAVGECDVPENCDGAGTCNPDVFVSDGINCGDPIDDACTNADTCLSGACAPNHAAPGAACGNPGDAACTDPDTCNGAGACQPNDATRGSWATYDHPQGRMEHGFAYDSARDVAVLFGGSNGFATNFSDTWEWSGASWTPIMPTDPEVDGNPAVRHRFSMSYDSGRGVTVLFGGLDAGTYKGDTWEWNGASWDERIPTDPELDGNPTPRMNAALAYDAEDGLVVLFGGKDSGGSTANGDTWGWNGVKWDLLLAEGLGPSSRQAVAMAYDSSRDVIVLYGGTDPDGFPLADTWEWDGSVWTEITPIDPETDGEPPPLHQAAMTYDPVRARSVLFAGRDGTMFGTETDDVWEWNGSSWAKRVVTGASPIARYGHAIVFSSVSNKPLLFGGQGSGGSGDVHADVWEFDGTVPAWTFRADTPPARGNHELAFDVSRGRGVLFGGQIAIGTWVGDTWEWDGITWQQRIPADPEMDGNPSARGEFGMAYDSLRAVTVLFGGTTGTFNGETWEWDGDSWNLRNPTDPEADGNPSPRQNATLAYDAGRNVTVLFGGQDTGGANAVDDTWEWNGTSWAERVPTDPEADGNPLARQNAGMAYDPSRSVVVLFGGSPPGGGTMFDDTWEWNGASWILRTPTDPEMDGNPEARTGHAMAFDVQLSRSVVHGGHNPSGTTLMNDTWMWDGTSWAKVMTVAGCDADPVGRALHGVAYDSERAAVVVFGGSVDWPTYAPTAETWVLP